MLVSSIKEEDLTFEMVDRLLFQGLEDTGENADCIIVLGSVKAAQYRVPVAVDTYNAGRASKLMLCGGTLRDFPVGKCSEAEHFKLTEPSFKHESKEVIFFAFYEKEYIIGRQPLTIWSTAVFGSRMVKVGIGIFVKHGSGRRFRNSQGTASCHRLGGSSWHRWFHRSSRRYRNRTTVPFPAGKWLFP